VGGWQVAGPPGKLKQMEDWLRRVGSPKSRIGRLSWRKAAAGDAAARFSGFEVRKDQ